MFNKRNKMYFPVRQAYDKLCIYLSILSVTSLLLLEPLLINGYWWTITLFCLYVISLMVYGFYLFMPAGVRDKAWLKQTLKEKPHWEEWVKPYRMDGYIPVWLIKELRSSLKFLESLRD